MLAAKEREALAYHPRDLILAAITWLQAGHELPPSFAYVWPSKIPLGVEGAIYDCVIEAGVTHPDWLRGTREQLLDALNGALRVLQARLIEQPDRYDTYSWDARLAYRRLVITFLQKGDNIAFMKAHRALKQRWPLHTAWHHD